MLMEVISTTDWTCGIIFREPRPIPIVVASPHTLAFHWLLMGLSDVRGDNRESSAP